MSPILWLALGAAVPAHAQSTDEPTAEDAEAVEDSEDSPDGAQDAMLKALRAEIEAQQNKLESQDEALEEAERTLAEQQAAIESLSEQMTDTKLKLIDKDDLKVELEGHYRVRGHVFNHLYASQGTGDDYRDARYISQRLWLRPTFNYRDLAKLTVEARALEDVVFGDNMSIATTPLFAGNPSNTNIFTGEDAPSITIGRAWTEFSVPVGLIRAGRQPSEWGMGLLVQPGDKFDHRVGESYYPTTNDRVLFATRPLAILSAITGTEDKDVPFIVAIAADRLVEDPLIQYYGYQCSPGIDDTEAEYDPRCDTDDDGVTDLDHSWTDDTRVASSRGPDWWADQNDDVLQMVYVLTYRGEGIDYLGGTGDLIGGFWIVTRSQAESESTALIVDGYFKAFVHNLLLEGELVSISADSRAITLPSSSSPDPIEKKASILGYAARAAYVDPSFKVQFETGYASGDDNVNDPDFTGRALHPDYNVGLLLYEEVIAQVTRAVWTDNASSLWSQGGVYNSRYIFPTAHVYPLDNWELLAGAVVAWPDRPDGAVIRCRDSDKVDCDTPSTLQATTDTLGWEVDVAVHHNFHEHLLFALEGAVAKATDRLPLEVAGLNPEGNFFTVQSRIAFQF